MGAFSYRAMEPSGRRRSGVIEADSARQARARLREQGLLPTEVNEVAAERAEGAGGRRNWFERPLPKRDLALLTRQLATLIQAGMPLEEALQAVAAQSDQPRLRSLLLAVRSRILEGYSLARALAEFPRTFDELYRAMVAAGEESGHLGEVLLRLAEHGERLQAIRSKIQVALIYPVVLTLVATGVIVLLMTHVVPKVVEQFDHVGEQLPLLTRVLIAVSDWLQQWGPLVLLLIAAGALAGRWLLTSERRRRRWHRWLLQVPVIRNFIIGQQALQFARTLSILLGSGLDLMSSLRIAAAPMTNLALRDAVEAATRRVREGSPLARALEQSGPFPPLLVCMIANGERSGDLAAMLDKAADNQQLEFETRVAWLLGLFEPALILVMGLIVLAIVLAILLPILQLNNLTAF